MKFLIVTVSFLNLLIFPLTAFAQLDAGAEDVSILEDAAVLDSAADADVHFDAGCTDTDYMGRCLGDELHYCHNGQDEVLVCSNPASYPQGGATATCGLLDCTDSDSCQGYWCVARAGTACGTLHCDISQQMACVDGICQNSEACGVAATGAHFDDHCDEAFWIYCSQGLVNKLDCSAGGTAPYTCQGGNPAAAPCAGLAGAQCDILAGRLCAEDLPCVAGYCQGPEDAGTVLEDASVDAGPEEAGGRPDAAKLDIEDPGCACSASSTSVQRSTLIVFAGLIILMRRRRFS